MRYIGVVILAGLLASACGTSTSSPASPTTNAQTSAASVTGTWAGAASDTAGSDKLTWTLSQTGAAMTGTMTINDAGRGMMGNGTMQGTVNGSTMTFHMTVPSGGFNGTMSACAMGVDGQATMSSDGHTMTGTYSGNMSGMMSGGMMGQSCGGGMNNGTFTMTR